MRLSKRCRASRATLLYQLSYRSDALKVRIYSHEIVG